MALSFFQQPRDRDRLICLTYPYRPLLESYVYPRKVEIRFIAHLTCCKCISNSGKYFDYEKFTDYLGPPPDLGQLPNIHELVYNTNLNFVANALLSILREFDCDSSSTAFIIMFLYYHIKCNLGSSAGSSHGQSKPEESEPLERVNWQQSRRNFYIFTSIQRSDVKFLQMLLRYGYECLASEDEYSSAMSTARNFA